MVVPHCSRREGSLGTAQGARGPSRSSSILAINTPLRKGGVLHKGVIASRGVSCIRG